MNEHWLHAPFLLHGVVRKSPGLIPPSSQIPLHENLQVDYVPRRATQCATIISYLLLFLKLFFALEG
jgi:hypothetical protein